MKNTYIQGLALVGLFLGNSAFGATVGMVQSGIDLYQSTIEIDYTKYTNDDHTTFECFGESQALISGNASVQKNLLEAFGGFDSDTTGGNRFSQEGASANEFIELAIDDPTNEELRNCFQQAGDYAVTVELKDAVGNLDSQVFNFTIKAASPNAEKTTVEDLGGCGTAYANNSDTCSLGLVIRDEFGNRVLELSGENVSVYDNRQSADPWASDDANLGTSFLQGIKLLGSYFFEKTSLGDAVPVTVSALADATLPFQSITPSLKKKEDGWQETVVRDYPITVQTPNVQNDGSLGIANALALNITAPLKFFQPLDINTQITAGIMDGGAFKSLTEVNTDNSEPDCGDPAATENTICPEWGADQVVKIDVLQNNTSGWGSLPSNIVGALQRFMYPPNLYKVQYGYDVNNPTPPPATTTENIFAGDVSYPSPDLEFFPADTPLGSQGEEAQPGGVSTDEGEYPAETTFNYSYIWKFLPPPASEWFNVGSAKDSLEIKTKIDYTLDSKNVSYFAGKYQADTDDNVLDILIEGFVSGSFDKVALIENLVRIGNTGSQDTRSTITANAFKLIRGAENVKNSDYTLNVSDFSSQDVIVVKGADAILGDLPTNTLTLPSGKKTLIVLDGNVNIKSDLAYANEKDSFGIILVNTPSSAVDSTNSTTYPQTGNIFVHSDVMNIAGSYFAEGGIMTQDSIPSSGDVFANVTNASQKQLILEGTLISRNTVGGGLTPDGDNEYTTPWGKIANDGGEVGKTVARRYDLRNIRAFSSAGGTGHSDPNINANQDGHPFILRQDRKAVNTPPPGFEIQETIRR